MGSVIVIHDSKNLKDSPLTEMNRIFICILKSLEGNYREGIGKVRDPDTREVVAEITITKDD